MREIKFRAWEISKNRMVDDVIPNAELSSSLSISGEWIMVNPNQGYEVMQYTGLKDNEDKEVYDGDIIKATKPREGYMAEDFIGKVYWFNGQFQWWITNGRDIDYSLDYLGYFYHFEVIGNIYENPDLLQS